MIVFMTVGGLFNAKFAPVFGAGRILRYGVIVPAVSGSMAMALQRYPHMAGTASSLMGAMTFGIGAVFGAVVGQALDGTIVPMTTAMGIAGILCLLSNHLLVPRS